MSTTINKNFSNITPTLPYFIDIDLCHIPTHSEPLNRCPSPLLDIDSQEADPAPIAVETPLVRNAKKAGKIFLCIIGVALGSATALAGTVAGVALMTHIYLNTGPGIAIFKIFSTIFVPISTAFGLASGAFATTFMTGLLATRFCAYAAAGCFAVPFAPVICGAIGGGAPGYYITLSCYQTAKRTFSDITKS